MADTTPADDNFTFTCRICNGTVHTPLRPQHHPAENDTPWWRRLMHFFGMYDDAPLFGGFDD